MTSIAVTTPVAQADTTRIRTRIEWDIADLIGGGFYLQARPAWRNMLDRVRSAVGHHYGPYNAGETEDRPGTYTRMVEVAFTFHGRVDGAVYFDSESLQMLGFWTPNGSNQPATLWGFSNTHRTLRDLMSQDMGHPVAVQELPFSGDFLNLSSSVFQHTLLTRGAMTRGFTNFWHFTPNMSSTAQRLWQEAFIVIWQLTVGAATSDQVAGDVWSGLAQTTADRPLPDRSLVVEEQWRSISRWVHRAADNRENPGVGRSPFAINGQNYRSIDELLRPTTAGGIDYMMIMGSAR